MTTTRRAPDGLLSALVAVLIDLDRWVAADALELVGGAVSGAQKRRLRAGIARRWAIRAQVFRQIQALEPRSARGQAEKEAAGRSSPMHQARQLMGVRELEY